MGFRVAIFGIDAEGRSPWEEEQLAFRWQRYEFAGLRQSRPAIPVAGHEQARVIAHAAVLIGIDETRRHHASLRRGLAKVIVGQRVFAGVLMFMLMLFMFCFFLGFMAMYFYLLKKLDAQSRAMNEEHAQMRVLLRAMESRLDKIAQTQRVSAMLQGNLDPGAVLPGEGGEEDADSDSLLHLSFEKPQNLDGAVNPGLSLDLEPAPWQIGAQKN